MHERDIRRIVREELAAILERGLGGDGLSALGPPEPHVPHGFDVERFVLSLTPGERVGAAALYERWKGWAEEHATRQGSLTMTAFGRILRRLSRVRRERGRSGRVYVVLGPPTPGCVPGCRWIGKEGGREGVRHAEGCRPPV